MKILIVWLAAAMFSFGVMTVDEEMRELEPGALVLGAILFWPMVLGEHFAERGVTTIVKSDRLACEGRGE